MEGSSSSPPPLPKELGVERLNNNEVNEKLKLTCSISTFQSNNLISFRNDLFLTIKQVVEISNIKHHRRRSVSDDDDSSDDDDNNSMSYVSYDPSQIEQSLNCIGWKELCQYHDAQFMRQQFAKKKKKEKLSPPTTITSTPPTTTTTTTGMSPLEEVVAAISKPMLIPRCCAGTILFILIKACIQAPKLSSQSHHHHRHRSSSKKNKDSAGVVVWTSRWSPAQSILLKAITAIYVDCPFVAGGGGSIHTTPMQKFLLMEDFEMQHSIPNEWNRLLSLAYTLAKDIPRLHFGMTIFIIDFIRRIDDEDISTLLINKNKRNKKSRRRDVAASIEKDIPPEQRCCPKCGGVDIDDENYHQTRKRKKIATLANLHDQDLTVCEGDEDGNNNKRLFRTWRHSKYRHKNPVSLKAVLKESSVIDRKRKASSVVYCQCIQMTSERKKYLSSYYSILSPEWNLLRSRGYKKFLCLFEYHDNMMTAVPMSSMRSRQSTNNRSHTQPKFRKFGIYELLELAHKHYSSPSIRICLLMCLDNKISGGGRQHVSTLKVCWQRYLTSKDDLWLRIYSEILVECKVFDERQVCWDLFLPILQRLLDDHDFYCCTTEDENYCLFRCVAYVLSRRCRLFQEKSDQIKHKFQETLTNLKVRFGESRYWVDDDLELVEKERTLEVLEKTGILGLVDLVDGAVDESDNGGGDDDKSNEAVDIKKEEASKIDCRHEKRVSMMAMAAIKSWPFHEPFDVGSTCSRLANEECSMWLSSPNHDENIIIEEKPEGKKSGLDAKNSEGHEILDFFDQDIFRLIFSYFGYKRLVMMREVCQMWKSIVDESNELWYSAYRNRFRVLSADPMLQGWLQKSSRNMIDWKNMFIEKWLVEQNINHQRNTATGWKHRSCRYLGCNHVLKSAKGEIKHYEIHSRKKRTTVETEETNSGDTRSRSKRKPQKGRKHTRTASPKTPPATSKT